MDWERVRFSTLKVGDAFRRKGFFFTVSGPTEKRRAMICDRLVPLCDLPWADDEEALAEADIIEIEGEPYAAWAPVIDSKEEEEEVPGGGLPGLLIRKRSPEHEMWVERYMLSKHERDPLLRKALPHVAFEYFIVSSRIIPVPDPKFQRNPETGRMELLFLVREEEVLPLELEVELPVSPDDLRESATAATILKCGDQFDVILSRARTPAVAEAMLNKQLAGYFVVEVGINKARGLAQEWLDQGPGFLTRKTSAKTP